MKYRVHVYTKDNLEQKPDSGITTGSEYETEPELWRGWLKELQAKIDSHYGFVSWTTNHYSMSARGFVGTDLKGVVVVQVIVRKVT